MMSEYLPRGPDESPSIRRLAEAEWKKITQSGQYREKSAFLQHAQTVTDELVGIENARRRSEATDRRRAYAQSLLQSDPRFHVPEVIRHASLASLTSSQGLRERLSSAMLSDTATGGNGNIMLSTASAPFDEEKRLPPSNWQHEYAHNMQDNSYRVHVPATGTMVNMKTAPAMRATGPDNYSSTELNQRNFFGTGRALEAPRVSFQTDDRYSELNNQRIADSDQRQQPWRLLNQSRGNIDSMENVMRTQLLQNDALEANSSSYSRHEHRPFNKYREESSEFGSIPTLRRELEEQVMGSNYYPHLNSRQEENDPNSDIEESDGSNGSDDECDVMSEDGVGETIHSTADIRTSLEDLVRRMDAKESYGRRSNGAPTHGGKHSSSTAPVAAATAVAAAATKRSNSTVDSSRVERRNTDAGVAHSSAELTEATQQYISAAADDKADAGTAEAQHKLDGKQPHLQEKAAAQKRRISTQRGDVQCSTIDSAAMKRYVAASAAGELSSSETSSTVQKDIPSLSMEYQPTSHAAHHLRERMNKTTGGMINQQSHLKKPSSHERINASTRVPGGSSLGSFLCDADTMLSQLETEAAAERNNSADEDEDNAADEVIVAVDYPSQDASGDNDDNDNDDDGGDEGEEVHIDLSSFNSEVDPSKFPATAGAGYSRFSRNNHSNNVFSINHNYISAPRAGEEASLRRGLANSRLHIHNQIPVAMDPVAGVSMLIDPSGHLGVVHSVHDPFLMTPQRYTHITAADAAACAARNRAIQDSSKASEIVMMNNADPSYVYVPVRGSDVDSTRDGYTLRNSIDLSGLSLARLREITGSY